MESCFDISLTFTRLHWVTSTILWFGILLTGGCRIVIPKFDVHNEWLIINKLNPTYMFVNAFQMATLCNDSYVGKRDIGSLISIPLSGSPIFEHQLSKYRKIRMSMIRHVPKCNNGRLLFATKSTDSNPTNISIRFICLAMSVPSWTESDESMLHN